MLKKIVITACVMSPFFVASISAAAEINHSVHHNMDHSKMDHSSMSQAATSAKPKTSGRLGVLKAVPKSGKAREAGYDGRYAMESTSARNSLATRCAQASRGLVMLDKAGWSRCGTKPKGLPKTVAQDQSGAKAMEHSQHMKH